MMLAHSFNDERAIRCLLQPSSEPFSVSVKWHVLEAEKAEAMRHATNSGPESARRQYAVDGEEEVGDQRGGARFALSTREPLKSEILKIVRKG